MSTPLEWSLGFERWHCLNMKLCKNGKIYSFLGWRLPKIQYALSQKRVQIKVVLYNFIFKPYHLLSPLAPLQGEIDICPRKLFCPKFDAEKLLFEAFFGIMHIFGSIQPKNGCIFPLLYNFIFKLYHRSSHLAPLRDEMHICPRGLFCPNSMQNNFYFEAFFGIMRIFGSIQPKSECIFPFLYNFIFKPYHLSSSLVPPWEEIYMPSWTFLSKIQCRKTFIWSFFWDNAYFWQRSAQKWIIIVFYIK